MTAVVTSATTNALLAFCLDSYNVWQAHMIFQLRSPKAPSGVLQLFYIAQYYCYTICPAYVRALWSQLSVSCKTVNCKLCLMTCSV